MNEKLIKLFNTRQRNAFNTKNKGSIEYVFAEINRGFVSILWNINLCFKEEDEGKFLYG